MKLYILLCALLSFPVSAKTLSAEQRDLLKALKPCLSPPEKLENFPVATERPKGNASYRLELNPTPLASDGFNYEITVYSAQNIAYVTQFGGIAGVNRTFGPINISKPCPLPTKPYKK
ncbi:MAG TPA: hypothetical protein PLW86_15845 [Rhodocyclaceae bacterium]|nr:hypothetical protein [Rhodocyclaceae bacterium]